MIEKYGKAARQASLALRIAPTQAKNRVLEHCARLCKSKSQILLRENELDLASAAEHNLSDAMIDRLRLTEDGIKSIARGFYSVAQLDDPVGQIEHMTVRPSGIRIGKMRVPIGVLGIIYESRPNVTADAAALCLKSGNAVVLRGGKEAIHTNIALGKIISEALEASNSIPTNAVQLVNETDRALVSEMVSAQEYFDMIIPRGGKGLISRVSRDAKVPVLKHLDGICHVYVDDFADIEKAITIAMNAKTHRYGVCNAMETLLVAASVANKFLPRFAIQLREKGVEIRGCARTCQLLTDAKHASEADWAAEYLDAILAIRIVDTFDEAVEHIETWGSHHTDAIVTESIERAEQFLTRVDSSSVMVNASTRFADGFEYGFGAEIGISTNRLHARGPVGLIGLTTQKFVVTGNGHIRI